MKPNLKAMWSLSHGGADSNADLKALTQLYLRLDEFSAGVGPVTRVDSGPNGLHLTDATNVPSAAGHVYALAADFEASTTEYLSHAAHSAYSFVPGKTYAVWFKPESLPTVALVHGQHTNDGGAYSFFGHVNNVWHFQTGHGAPHTFVTVPVGGAGIGTNVFAVYWHNPAQDKLFLQINDGTVASSAGPDAPSSYMTTDPTAEWDIGRRAFPAADNPWDGTIEAFAIFNGVLSAEQRTRLYNGGAGLALY